MPAFVSPAIVTGSWCVFTCTLEVVLIARPFSQALIVVGFVLLIVRGASLLALPALAHFPTRLLPFSLTRLLEQVLRIMRFVLLQNLRMKKAFSVL